MDTYSTLYIILYESVISVKVKVFKFCKCKKARKGDKVVTISCTSIERYQGRFTEQECRTNDSEIS